MTQQVKDALSVDQYIKAHTVMLGRHARTPGGGPPNRRSTRSSNTCTPLTWRRRSDLAVADFIGDIDQYVKTHTVMVENMVAPLGGADLSSC